MIILKTLLSGGNAAQLTETSSVQSDSGRGGARRETCAKEVDSVADERIRKMEFMYCIPDLEVFIDKTIKKCLLEYDLDANDTEAVLDDMEKAWPKSPPRTTEKQVLKDSNENSQKGRSNKHSVVANEFQEAALLDSVLGKDTVTSGHSMLSYNNVKNEEPRQVAESSLSKKGDPEDIVSNGKRELEHAFVDGDRSDTSSPDVIDGKLQARKHPKLKSLLQQRYQESCNYNKEKSNTNTEDKLVESWDTTKGISSNLDLLASAANIHTESARGTEEHMRKAIRRLQEESERQFHANALKRFQNNSVHETSPREMSGRMPVLLKLMTSSSSPSPLLEYNNESDVVNGHHSNGLKTVSPETCQRRSPSGSSGDDPHFLVLPRQHEKHTSALLSRERTQRLYQHHQNDYRVHTPHESVIIRRNISSSPIEGSSQLGKREMSASTTHSGPSWNSEIDRATATSNYNHFSPNARYQRQNQNQTDHHIYSGNIQEPFHYHGSRIASIIAEELQKDDDCGHDLQTHLSDESIIPANIQSSTIYESPRIRSFSLPGTYKRVASSDFTNRPSQVSSVPSPNGTHYKVANTNESSVHTHSRTMPQLLPAHLVMTNTHSGSAILASHLGHTTLIGSNGVKSNRSIIHDDDQPQDLSTKSRRIAEDEDQHGGHYFSSSNPTIPASESETREYLSTRISPLSTPDRVRLLESPPSASQSDRECDYDCRNDACNKPIKMLESGRKDNVQGFDIYPERVKNSQLLARNMKPKSTNVCSEPGNSEIVKRRKIE